MKTGPKQLETTSWHYYHSLLITLIIFIIRIVLISRERTQRTQCLSTAQHQGAQPGPHQIVENLSKTY